MFYFKFKSSYVLSRMISKFYTNSLLRTVNWYNCHATGAIEVDGQDLADWPPSGVRTVSLSTSTGKSATGKSKSRTVTNSNVRDLILENSCKKHK